MGTWPAHHVACAFIFKVVFTTVCHLPCLNLSRPLHFLPPRVVCCITMETLAHLLLLPLHLWQKTSRDKDWQLTSEHNRFIDFLSCFDNRRTCISDKPPNKHLIYVQYHSVISPQRPFVWLLFQYMAASLSIFPIFLCMLIRQVLPSWLSNLTGIRAMLPLYLLKPSQQ